jgi:hypothetical protein
MHLCRQQIWRCIYWTNSAWLLVFLRRGTQIWQNRQTSNFSFLKDNLDIEFFAACLLMLCIVVVDMTVGFMSSCTFSAMGAVTYMELMRLVTCLLSNSVICFYFTKYTCAFKCRNKFYVSVSSLLMSSSRHPINRGHILGLVKLHGHQQWAPPLTNISQK